MKIYFAGIAGNKVRLDYLKEFGANKLMLTFANVSYYSRNMQRFKEGEFDLLFDSGAFSSWKRGVVINLKEYCSYLNFHNIKKYIVLDEIGNHTITMENQRIMENEGMNPIPAYHLNSPIENLYEICENYEYVCLGGTVGAHFNIRMNFFENVFKHFPDHRFHGLGLTDIRIIKSFPFYSVDSTTWLIAEKVGKIFDNNGKRCNAPPDMSAKSKFQNTINYFVKMESKNGSSNQIP